MLIDGRAVDTSGARSSRTQHEAATYAQGGSPPLGDDVSLSRALVAGDDEAFRVLIERETTRVFRTCYRILGRVDEAEEATQETFVLAYRALGTYRGEGHPSAWLARIATRESWRLSAAGSRRRARTATLDQDTVVLHADTPDPLDHTIRAEESDRVRAAVRRLPEPYREVVTLRFFGGLSLVEICAATRSPEGTVKAQMHRALGRLREMLREERR